MNKIMHLNSAIFFGVLIAIALFSLGCDDHEDSLPVNDFFHIKIDNKERIYEFKDSTRQICTVSNYDRSKFDFYAFKVYESNDREFPFMTFDIVKDSASNCPETQFNTLSYYHITFTQLGEDNRFIDYESFEPYMATNFKLNQKVVDGKIVMTGTFSGWIYQLYPSRSEGQVTEPRRIDSLFVQDALFQFTSK